MEDIWLGQPLLDVIYLGVGVCFVVGLTSLMLVPGLLGMIFYAKETGKGEDAVPMYVSRFFPYGLYSGVVGLFNLLCNTTIVLSALHFAGYLEGTFDHLQALTLFGQIILVQLGVHLLRLVCSGLWQLAFGNQRPLHSLTRQDNLSINLLAGLLKLVVLSVLLANLSLALSLGLVGALFTMYFLLRAWHAIARLRGELNSYIYIFLYLCTCEILPYLYFLVGYAYLTNKELLDKLH